MAQNYSPKIVQDSLVMCIDPSQNKSYPTTDLPVKAGLVMWMDASDDTTFSYSSGTTVSQWRDKSPSGFHMTPKSGGPTRNAFLNSRKVLAFTTSQTIGNNTINLATSPNTVFVVSRYNNLAGSKNRVLTCNLDASGNNWLLGHWGGYVNQYYAEGWVRYQVDVADTTWRVYMGDYSGPPSTYSDLANLYSNGTAVTTNSNNASAGPNKLGINYYSGEPSDCEVAEIVVFNRVLTAVERRLIDTYLGQKWGISNTDRSVIDLGGNNYNGLFGNGTIANMPLFDFYNKGALKLDGSNDYITTGVSGIVPTSAAPYTVSVWCYRNVNNSSYRELLSQWTNANSGNSFYFGFDNSNVRFTDNWGPITVSGAGNTNVWMNLVGVYTVSNAFIYLNGVLAATKGSGFTYTGTGPFIVGRQGELNGEYFDGNIGSVLVYQKALSAAEVAQNYEAQKSKFADAIVQQGLVLNVDASNPYSYAGAGTTWYDTSEAVNDFTIANSPTYSTNEFILNGSTQFFYNTSAASGFFISSTNNFYADVGYAWTISVWFKFPVSPTTTRNSANNGGNCSYCMVGNGGGIGGAETLALFVSGGDNTTSAGSLAPYFCVVGIRGAKTQLSLGSVNTNTWNNVIVTWNGSAGRGYFNGVDRGALNIGSAGMQINGYTIGTQVGGNQGSHTYEGSLSQVLIYNRAISAAEALQNYNATKGRFGL